MAALAGALLFALLTMAWLMVLLERPVPPGDRTTSPGFGWSWDFDYRRAMKEAGPSPAGAEAAKAHGDGGGWSLVLDSPVSVGDLELTYRGRTESGKLRIDTVMRALDPHYAYPREIDPDSAREGFSLGSEFFRLESVDNDRIRLEREESGRP
jgi:hypothetical protein